MKKKFFITSFSLFLSVVSVNAAVNYMTVELNNEDKCSFKLADKPFITYNKGELVVNADAKTSYAISNVKNYHFTENDETGVNALPADGIGIGNIDESTISVQNVPQGTIVTLMNVKGVLLSSQQTLADGNVLVNLPKSKGVYIINVGNQSFKVIRR